MAITRIKPTGLNNIATFSFANSNLGNLATANFFSGNGSLLSGVVASTVSATSQPNISSVGTLSSLTVAGLVTATAGGVKVGNLQDNVGTNTIQLLNSNVFVTGNLSVGAGGTGNVTATYFIGNGSQLTSIASATTAGTVTTGAQPNITSVGSLTGLNVTGVTTLAETTEIVAVPTGTTYDYTLGSVFYVNQPGANFTPNFTNVPTTDNRITVITLIINQSATPGMPTAMQIGGTAQTIKWPSGTIPTGVASSIQTVAFAFLRYGAAWIVTGASGAYI